MAVESYIVRIYRRHAKPGAGVVGIVEKVGGRGAKPFHSVDELTSLLTRQTRFAKNRRLRDE